VQKKAKLDKKMYKSYMDHAIQAVVSRALDLAAIRAEALEDICEKVHRPRRGLALKSGKRRESLSILNECAVDCGESVGGPSPASAAPEVAADGGDGDGDGDPDPEPARRRGRPRNSRNSLPPAAEYFDRLPDSACIDIAALKAITGKSRATLYRWIDKGILPKPRKFGLTSNNVWAAGDIRRALSA